MSLYLKQNETRSQLQDKLAKELQERAKEKAKEAELPDGVNDSAYIEGTHQTSIPAWVWLVVIIAIMAAVLWLVFSAI